MEPPAKRARTAADGPGGPGGPDGPDGPDEPNVDPVLLQQQSRALLKSRFESIFAQFENMPAEEQDEIDLNDKYRIVVDRGHVKSMQDLGRTGAMGQIALDLLSDNEGEDDVDELAPSPPLAPSPKPRRQQDPEADRGVEAEGKEEQPKLTKPVEPANLIMQLTQLTSLPQTPAAPQHQSAFISQLSIAISQAVTSTLSNYLGTAVTNPSASDVGLKRPTDPAWYYPPLPEPTRTPRPTLAPSTPPILAPSAPTILAPSTLAVLAPSTSAILAPSTSPILAPSTPAILAPSTSAILAPSPPAILAPSVPVTLAPDSSASSAPATAQTKRRWSSPRYDQPFQFKRKRQRGNVVRAPAENATTKLAKAPVSLDRDTDSNISKIRSYLEETRKYRTISRLRKYNFSIEDELFIIEQKEIYNTSWRDIKESRGAWKDWPDFVLSQYYKDHLRDRDEDVDEDCALQGVGEAAQDQAEVMEASVPAVETPVLSSKSSQPKRLNAAKPVSQDHHSYPSHQRQLLTPSTFGSVNSTDSPEAIHYNRSRLDGSNDTDLLDTTDDYTGISLAGLDGLKEQVTEEARGAVTSSIAPEDIIPSIETRIPIPEDRLPNPQPRTPLAHTPTNRKSKPASGPLSSAKRRNPHPTNFKVDSDSDSGSDSDDLDLVPTGEEDLTKPFICNTCGKRYKRQGNLSKHIKHSPNGHVKSGASLPTANLDNFDDQTTSPIPKIKQEPSTPGPSLLLLLSTPRSAPQPNTLLPSAVRSIPKLSKKKIQTEVKAAWAKRAKRYGTPALKEHQSMLELSSRRDESDDELA
ncbi:uncharacterized protein BDR25DRAFT_305185 [Lindgomyces ingoldianus]|uniref:Uncharacterized protein n=1 Tax=Lindgomyces ingoldianus TaxID=673940 RepID=A0ACB6QMF0_9PLEO|nr:uncharacterized protein BDR25DRAFT_305185 [Lindgomyces ingoldianus]KAF2468194.1 hypothetical protein BDR25DRAFT_305185 [Lindgomyces ingoldianus]